MFGYGLIDASRGILMVKPYRKCMTRFFTPQIKACLDFSEEVKTLQGVKNAKTGDMPISDHLIGT